MQLTKLTVEEWVIKQPKFLGQLAAMLATIADDLPQMLELVFTDQISKKIGPPPKTPPRTTQTPPKIPPYTPPPRDPTRWVRFYRDHRQVMRVMLSVLPVQMSPEMFDDLQPFSHKLPVNLPSGELPNIQTKNARKWKECIGGFLPPMMDITRGRFKVSPKQESNPNLSSYEAQFFGEVVIPYLVLHGTWPTKDFASARRGNLDALERILLIDILSLLLRATRGFPHSKSRTVDGRRKFGATSPRIQTPPR